VAGFARGTTAKGSTRACGSSQYGSSPSVVYWQYSPARSHRLLSFSLHSWIRLILAGASLQPFLTAQRRGRYSTPSAPVRTVVTSDTQITPSTLQSTPSTLLVAALLQLPHASALSEKLQRAHALQQNPLQPNARAVCTAEPLACSQAIQSRSAAVFVLLLPRSACVRPRVLRAHAGQSGCS
jgi:hypothetical protein